MNNIFKSKFLKPIFLVMLIYSFGLIFQIIPALRLFYGQISLMDLFLILFVMIFISKIKIKEFGFKKAKFKTYIFSIIITFIYVFSFSLIQYQILKVRNINSSENNYPLVLMILVPFLIAPISEELIFRGYLQESLADLKNKGFRIYKVYLNIPIIISALLFSIAHLGIITKGVNLSFVFCTMIFAFFLGLISGYYKEKSESIYPSIVIHSFANLISALSIFVFTRLDLFLIGHSKLF